MLVWFLSCGVTVCLIRQLYAPSPCVWWACRAPAPACVRPRYWWWSDGWVRPCLWKTDISVQLRFCFTLKACLLWLCRDVRVWLTFLPAVNWSRGALWPSVSRTSAPRDANEQRQQTLQCTSSVSLPRTLCVGEFRFTHQSSRTYEQMRCTVVWDTVNTVPWHFFLLIWKI